MDHSKLRRMANQIATNLAAKGEAVAIEETAVHIWKFWDPRMKAAIFADDLADLSPIARAAIEKLKADAAAAA
jgi:formate dehydrogenase subunit delta